MAVNADVEAGGDVLGFEKTGVEVAFALGGLALDGNGEADGGLVGGAGEGGEREAEDEVGSGADAVIFEVPADGEAGGAELAGYFALEGDTFLAGVASTAGTDGVGHASAF